MINKTNLDALQGVLLRKLADTINSRGLKIKPTVEDVFANLENLYDEIEERQFGERTGNVIKFMPVWAKRIILRLLSPTARLSRNTQFLDDCVVATVFLFLDIQDTNPVTQGKAVVPYTACQQDDATEYQKRAYCEAMAIGEAESKALQAFGIGAWYRYELEPEDNPDRLINTVQNSNSCSPTIGYSNVEAKETAKAETTPTPAPAEADMVPTPTFTPAPDTPVITDEIKEEEKPKAKRSAKAKATETIEPSDKELEMLAEVGKAKGKTLGEIATKYPGNLLWLYVNPDVSDAQKSAILTIAKADEKILGLFQSKGIAC